ncbi:MAG: metal-dependent transcriptional regulator [Bacteroidia bacterium]|jgi:DtxR family Mn-dependent transcriptional regulator|nr:metal-dependent transcriptional regulator [Bacteroidia bacterium]GIV23457.1 MAG: iron-dependent repressor [Bacteroidia bacterium]
MQTPAEENYLKALWYLGGATQEVSMQALTQRIGATPGAVTDMIKRLSEKGYITYRPYYGVRLTEEGLRIAVRVVRRHRIWETFVSEKLGYTGEKIHELAEQLEHVCDDEFIERLYGYLGEPKVDPHGDEIPPPVGQSLPLSRLGPGQKGVIQGWRDLPSVREGMTLLALTAGDIVEVLGPFPSDRALWVRCKGQTFVMPPTLAENLWVNIV